MGESATAIHALSSDAPALLTARLRQLYGHTEGFEVWLNTLVTRLRELHALRPRELRALDAERRPDWFCDQRMLGYCTYVDRFGGTLRGVAERLPHLQSLGVRYLHLLPFTRARAGDNDGGFAVSDYDDVEPALGSVEDLRALCAELRDAGISLCSDFVLNHCADDHAWARAARSGDPHYRGYFHVVDSAQDVADWEAGLREVFPHTAPGNFTRCEAIDGWVWTTFYPYQWDLNWSNREVFAEMLFALLRAANRGVEAFRLDSTGFLWKRRGTDCMNQPEAHWILQAIRAAVQWVAPGVLLKAEAIVPMRDLSPYFGEGDERGQECHLAYHSSLMTAAWSGLALQRGDIPAHILRSTPALPANATWIQYVRCHDDIGWPVLSHEASGATGVAEFDQQTVAAYFAGSGDSDAEGEAFQVGEAGGVHGSNGMTAALCGLSRARRGERSAEHLQRAQRRFLLMHALMLTVPGLPVIYMGDEIALDNDDSYRSDPARRHEGRWLHRPPMPWREDGQVQFADAVARDVHGELLSWIRLRQERPELRADSPCQVLPSSSAVLAFLRGEHLLAMFNFSAHTKLVDLPQGSWRDLRDDSVQRDTAALPGFGVCWLQWQSGSTS